MPGSLVGVDSSSRRRAPDDRSPNPHPHSRSPLYITPVGDDFVVGRGRSSGIVLLAGRRSRRSSGRTVHGQRLVHRPVDVRPHGRTSGRFAITYDLRDWVNDGLMTVFFFVVGLEIKRELVEGELTTAERPRLPVIAAVGGMVGPGARSSSPGTSSGPRQRRLGHPDGDRSRVRARRARAAGAASAAPGLKLFLLTLAIVDDIGAIIVIARLLLQDVQIEWARRDGRAPRADRRCPDAAGWRSPRALVRAAGVRVLWVCTFKSGVHAHRSRGVRSACSPRRGRATSGACSIALERRCTSWTSFARRAACSPWPTPACMLGADELTARGVELASRGRSWRAGRRQDRRDHAGDRARPAARPRPPSEHGDPTAGRRRRHARRASGSPLRCSSPTVSYDGARLG